MQDRRRVNGSQSSAAASTTWPLRAPWWISTSLPPMSCEPGGVAIRAMCGDIAVVLIPSPPPLAAVWEVLARRFPRRVGALSSCARNRGDCQGTVLPNSSGSLAKMAAIRRASPAKAAHCGDVGDATLFRNTCRQGPARSNLSRQNRCPVSRRTRAPESGAQAASPHAWQGPPSLGAPQRTNGSIPSIFGGEIGTGMRRVPVEFVTRSGAQPPTSPSCRGCCGQDPQPVGAALSGFEQTTYRRPKNSPGQDGGAGARKPLQTQRLTLCTP
jgi:hypothetical protein